jgi:hypothetical protein
MRGAMGPEELVKELNVISNRLHHCGKESFTTEDEVEAWEVACGAVDALRTIVVGRAQMTAPDDISQAERRGLVSRLIGRIEEEDSRK